MCGSAGGFRGGVKKNMSGVIMIQRSKTHTSSLTGTLINILTAKTLKPHPQVVLLIIMSLQYTNIMCSVQS